MRVALIKVGALGDVLRTTALLPGFRRLHPSLDLTWITAREALPLVSSHPDVSEAVDPNDLSINGWRHRFYDWVVSLDDDRDLCRLAADLPHHRLSGGYEDQNGCLRYTPDLECWFGMGILRSDQDGGLRRANQLKRENSLAYGEIFYTGLALPPPIERPSLSIPACAREWAHQWIRGCGVIGKPLVALNTAAGPRWRFKSWGEQQTAELARKLAEELHLGVIITGGPAEVSRNMRIVSAANSPDVVAAPTELSLLSFASLVRHCSVLVTSDSLAMHIGIALQLPVIALFGPTSDAEIDLFGLGEKIVTPSSCRRCYLADCDVRPHCMESITVSELYNAVYRWL
jgi:ADP-heptose:LPS heptosyltransferase